MPTWQRTGFPMIVMGESVVAVENTTHSRGKGRGEGEGRGRGKEEGRRGDTNTNAIPMLVGVFAWSPLSSCGDIFSPMIIPVLVFMKPVCGNWEARNSGYHLR